MSMNTEAEDQQHQTVITAMSRQILVGERSVIATSDGFRHLGATTEVSEFTRRKS